MIYFPLDLDFFENPKIQKLRSAQGDCGCLCFLWILSAIYDKGYYIEADELRRLCGKEDRWWPYPIVEEILRSCLSIDLLRSQLVAERQVFTSREIQRRYVNSASRNSAIVMRQELLLITQSDLPPGVTLRIERGEGLAPAPPDSGVPTLEEVLVEAKRIGYAQGEKYYTYYSRRSWRLGGVTWQEKLAEWKRTETKPAKPYKQPPKNMSFDINEAFERALRRSYNERDK